MSNDNAATILLKGDPRNLNITLSNANKSVHSFAGSASKDIIEVETASEGASSSIMELGATALKNAPAIAEFIFSFTKLGAAIGLAEMAISGMETALASSGHKIGVFDESLTGARKILNDTQGDIDKINDKLMELGVSAEEVGIKVEDNLSRVQDSFKKFYAELADKDGLEELKKVGGFWENLSRKTQKDNEATTRSFSDLFKFFGDTGTAAVKELREDFRDFFLQLADYNNEQIDVLKAQEKYAEEAVKQSKIREYREALYKQELADFEQYILDRNRLVKDQEIAEQHSVITSAEYATKRLAQLQAERKELILSGQWHGKVIDDWMVKDKTLFSQQQELLQQTQALRREISRDLGHEGTQRQDAQVRATKLANAAEVASHAQIRSMISDEEEDLEKFTWKRATDNKDFERQVREIQQRIALLRQADHAAELREVAELNDRKIHAINQQLELTKLQTKLSREVTDVRTDIGRNDKIRQLELEGVNYKKIHDLKMKFIDEEEKKEISRLEVQDPQAIERIKAGAAKQRLMQVAEYQEKLQTDVRNTLKVQEDDDQRNRDEAFEKRNTSEREKHEYILKRLEEEQRKEVAAAKTQADALKLRLDYERRITEEKERFTKLQKEGVDVDDKIGRKPLKLSEQNAILKKQVKERAKALADAKKAKAQTATDKKDKLKNDRDTKLAAIRDSREKALKNQKEVDKRAKAKNARTGDAKRVANEGAARIQSTIKEVLASFTNKQDEAQKKVLAKDDNKLLSLIAQSTRDMSRVMGVVSTKLDWLKGIGALK